MKDCDAHMKDAAGAELPRGRLRLILVGLDRLFPGAHKTPLKSGWYSHISIPCGWEAVQLQEQVTLELPGPPGAVRFCMGLGRPGHRSAERAAAATVGAPRRENNEKLPGSGCRVRRYE